MLLFGRSARVLKTLDMESSLKIQLHLGFLSQENEEEEESKLKLGLKSAFMLLGGVAMVCTECFVSV